MTTSLVKHNSASAFRNLSQINNVANLFDPILGSSSPKTPKLHQSKSAKGSLRAQGESVVLNPTVRNVRLIDVHAANANIRTMVG